MAKYQVMIDDKPKYEKNYKLPLINIVPAVIWSIPFHQKLFPDAGWWMTFGLYAAFVVVYVVLSYLPIIVAVPSIAGVIILTALFWCQTAHCGRGKSHFIFGGLASPIVPYRNLTQTTDGITADCRSLV